MTKKKVRKNKQKNEEKLKMTKMQKHANEEESCVCNIKIITIIGITIN